MMDADDYTDAATTTPDAADDTGEPLDRCNGEERTEGSADIMLATFTGGNDGEADADAP